MTLTIKARELSQLQPLYQFAVSDGHGGSVGELAFQGYDIDEQFVYYYEGMGYLEADPSKAYVSVLDKKRPSFCTKGSGCCCRCRETE